MTRSNKLDQVDLALPLGFDPVEYQMDSTNQPRPNGLARVPDRDDVVLRWHSNNELASADEAPLLETGQQALDLAKLQARHLQALADNSEISLPEYSSFVAPSPAQLGALAVYNLVEMIPQASPIDETDQAATQIIAQASNNYLKWARHSNQDYFLSDISPAFQYSRLGRQILLLDIAPHFMPKSRLEYFIGDTWLNFR